MVDYDIVQAGLITMATIAVNLVILATGGAIIDHTDYQLYAIDDGSHPKWAYVGHITHDWFYALSGIVCLVSVIWFVKTLVKKAGYNKMNQW